jgi:hypothetical protein
MTPLELLSRVWELQRELKTWEDKDTPDTPDSIGAPIWRLREALTYLERRTQDHLSGRPTIQ